MRVSLLNLTPVTVALEAALTCTNSESKIDSYDAAEFLKKLVSMGHESVIEHVVYSFVIEGVSRALLQELARHRHVSLSVQSTRWALGKTVRNKRVFSEDEAVVLQDSDKAATLSKLKETSETLQSQLEEAVRCGIPNDVLKYYIQESTTTKLVMTLNARELRHIFRLRTSPRALKEFQTLCRKMFDELPYSHRFLYEEFFTT